MYFFIDAKIPPTLPPPPRVTTRKYYYTHFTFLLKDTVSPIFDWNPKIFFLSFPSYLLRSFQWAYFPLLKIVRKVKIKGLLVET